jgi:hypothetical protein
MHLTRHPRKKEETPTGITVVIEIQVGNEVEIARLVVLIAALHIAAIVIVMTMSVRLSGIRGSLDQKIIPRVISLRHKAQSNIMIPLCTALNANNFCIHYISSCKWVTFIFLA